MQTVTWLDVPNDVWYKYTLGAPESIRFPKDMLSLKCTTHRATKTIRLSRCVIRVFSSEASPTIWSCYANLNYYHYFLLKLIPYTVYKHGKICICMTKYRAGFTTGCVNQPRKLLACEIKAPVYRSYQMGEFAQR